MQKHGVCTSRVYFWGAEGGFASLGLCGSELVHIGLGMHTLACARSQE